MSTAMSGGHHDAHVFFNTYFIRWQWKSAKQGMWQRQQTEPLWQRTHRWLHQSGVTSNPGNVWTLYEKCTNPAGPTQKRKGQESHAENNRVLHKSCWLSRTRNNSRCFKVALDCATTAIMVVYCMSHCAGRPNKIVGAMLLCLRDKNACGTV